jgi:hypothetical protein
MPQKCYTSVTQPRDGASTLRATLRLPAKSSPASTAVSGATVTRPKLPTRVRGQQADDAEGHRHGAPAAQKGRQQQLPDRQRGEGEREHRLEPGETGEAQEQGEEERHQEDLGVDPVVVDGVGVDHPAGEPRCHRAGPSPRRRRRSG